MKKLHEILNAGRIAKELTYEGLHERLAAYAWPSGTKAPSLSVVGHWLNGTRRPRDMEHLRALCRVLDVTLDEAIKGAPAEAKTGEEQAMLDLFRSTGDRERELLLAMAAQFRLKSG